MSAAELVGVVGEEESGVGEDVFVAGVLERLKRAAVEVAEVGGGVELDAIFEDVLIKTEDHALVLAGLEARVLL